MNRLSLDVGAARAVGVDLDVLDEAVFRDDGSNGWLVTHHSLDGREARE